MGHIAADLLIANLLGYSGLRITPLDVQPVVAKNCSAAIPFSIGVDSINLLPFDFGVFIRAEAILSAKHPPIMLISAEESKGVEMRKSGGIIALVAGIFGVLAALVTLFVGGAGAAFDAKGASTVIGLGWGGVLFSFATIVLGAVAMNAEGKIPGVLLIICSVLGAILGGTFVAIFMVLAFVGGLLAVLGSGKAAAAAR